MLCFSLLLCVLARAPLMTPMQILPMFAIGVPHVHTFMYGAEAEDFKSGAARHLPARVIHHSNT